MVRGGRARPVVRFASIGALPSQPMVVLAAKLRELARILNAGNNLTLRAVVLQPTRAWAEPRPSARPRLGACGTSAPRLLTRLPVIAMMRWLWGDFPQCAPRAGGWSVGGLPPRLQSDEDRRTGN